MKKLCHRTEFLIRSDGIIENFSNWAVEQFFGRIPLVGRLKGRSDERRSVALPPFFPFNCCQISKPKKIFLLCLWATA